MEAIISSIIVGGLALVGVILTNISTNKEVDRKIERNQAVMEAKLENLIEEVRKHNNFAVKFPVLEEQIKVINHRLTDLEKKKGDS